MENNFSNIKERILQVADYYGISKEKFFEELGITYGNFKGSAKERPINSSFLENLLTKYSDLDPDWLLLGRGEMLRKTMTNSIHGHGNIANNGDLNNSGTIDMRSYNSDSPDVLRSQVDALEERIREKDAQIREKDAQIKDLHEIIKQLSKKD